MNYEITHWQTIFLNKCILKIKIIYWTKIFLFHKVIRWIEVIKFSEKCITQKYHKKELTYYKIK